MSQYLIGTVAIDSATPTTVTGTATFWTSVNAPVTENTTFKLAGLPTIYPIESIDYDAQTITLVAPGYLGATVTGQSYQIQKDFTGGLGIPEINPNDADFASYITRGLRIIDSAIALATTYGVVLKGTWNATTNTPELPAAAVGNTGWMYSVSVGGTYDGTVYVVGDSVVSNGTVWFRQPSATTAEIIAVSEIADDVTTVAENIADVSAVAAIDADVSAVAVVASGVALLVPIVSDISAVSAVASGVAALSPIVSGLTLLAGVVDEVTQLSAVTDEMEQLGPIASGMTLIAGSILSVNTVASGIAAINTVASGMTAVSTTADSIADVSAVAAIASGLTLVAGSIADVNTVASGITAINSAATNMAAIIAAPGAASDASDYADAAQASAEAAAAIANAFIGTSTTSWTPAVESKAFTTQSGELYTDGIFVTIVSASNPSDYGWGQVTSYSGTTLTVNVLLASGSTPRTDWNISLSGVRGVKGDKGDTGDITTATSDTSPEDADIVYGGNAGDSFNAIKTTWTVLKAFLKTYFDGVYQAAGTYLTTITDSISTTSSTTAASATAVKAAYDLANGKASPNADTTGSAGSVKSNATTGVLQVVGPATGQTRVMTVPDADFTVSTPGLQTCWVPAGAMVSRTTTGAASGSVEMGTNKNMFKTLDFDTAADEFAQFMIQMPKSWDEGTVTFAPVWSHAATTTNFGVAWFLQAVAVSNDDAGDVAFGTAQSSVDTGGTTNDIYVGPASSAITIAGTPAANDYVMFQICRDVSDGGDTMAIDARLHGIQLFYTTNAATDA